MVFLDDGVGKQVENANSQAFSERLQNKMFFAGGHKGSGSVCLTKERALLDKPCIQNK